MHSQQATQTTHQQMPHPERFMTFSSTPPVSRSIKIVPTKLDASQLQQENYEAFVNSRDDRMYHRIATSRGGSAPLSTIVHNSLPAAEKASPSTSYGGEEGIFEIDL